MRYILRLFGFDTTPVSLIKSISMGVDSGYAALILLWLFLLPIVYYFYKFEGKKIKTRRANLLLGLRLVWVLFISFLIVGPVLIVAGPVPQKNRIAVMLDTSKSMSIQSGDKSRIDIIKDVFEKKKLLSKLQSKTGIYPDVFAFTEHVSPVSKQEIDNFAFVADGNHTDISGAIQNILSNLGEGSLLGIILLTDGVPTKGDNPLLAASNIRVPIHFISPGSELEPPDLAIRLNNPPSLGYLDSSVRVQGEVFLHNYTADSLEVTIYKDGEPYTAVNADFAAIPNRGRFSFNISCKEEGSFKFEAKISQVDNELTHENNSAAFLLKVIRERLNVLAISSTPNWDMKFISNALATDKNSYLTSWLKVSDDRWLLSLDFKPQGAVKKPNFDKSLSEADVLILDGINYADIRHIESEIIKRLETGVMGLLILPARKTFYELGYKNSELIKKLPVRAGSEVWRGNPANLILPSSELTHNFLRLKDDPIENLEFFASLPMVDGLYEYDAIQPGAEILISSSLQGKSGALPLLLTSRVGQGNLILFTGAPLWQMGFRLVPSTDGFAKYAAFIINMFKWLADRREDAQVALELPSNRGFVGQALPIRVWIMNEQRQLQSGAQVVVIAEDPTGNSIELSCIETSEVGKYETSFVPGVGGLFNLEAIARFQGAELGRNAANLLVEIPTAEFDRPIVDFELMSQIASITKGIAVEANNVDNLIAQIKPVAGQKTETKIFDLRDSWLLLILMLSLPLLEWYLRRTGGLS